MGTRPAAALFLQLVPGVLYRGHARWLAGQRLWRELNVVANRAFEFGVRVRVERQGKAASVRFRKRFSWSSARILLAFCLEFEKGASGVRPESFRLHPGQGAGRLRIRFGAIPLLAR